VKRDACARRPSKTRRLWGDSECALHRFARPRFQAAVRGVSRKLLRARSRVLGLPCDFRAPRPRCIRPTSTHPSSHPREPVTSCAPEHLRSLRFVLVSRAWGHREPPRRCRVLPLGSREACIDKLGPADTRGRGNACFTTRVFASVNRHGTRGAFSAAARTRSDRTSDPPSPSSILRLPLNADLRFFR